MPKAMTRDQYADFISLQLGGSIVDVEIEEDLGRFVDLALLKCKPYIGTSRLVTVPSASHIDLSKLDPPAYAVVAVHRGSASSVGEALSGPSVSTGVQPDPSGYDGYLFSPGLYNYYDAFAGSVGVGSMDSMTITLLTTQLVNTIRGGTSDVDFYQDNDDLYVELTGTGVSGDVTIEYIPDYTDVSMVSEPFWVNFIMNMAMALAKVAIGRARSKYNISGLPYELDGDNLVSEGTTELENLNEQLRSLDDIWYVLD